MEPINRKLLKENGKNALRGNFWMIMLVVFVASLLGANWSGLSNGSGISMRINNFNSHRTGSTTSTEEFLKNIEHIIGNSHGRFFEYDYDRTISERDNIVQFLRKICLFYDISEEELMQMFCIVIAIIILVVLVVSLLITCIQFLIGSFLGSPVRVGYQRYFMKNRKQEAIFSDLFSSFRSGKYMKIVKAMFAANIRIWAWSLLFYFPGLIKSYQYYFVPYIMAENPEISSKRARELSCQMTNGHKWQIFVLELSFIGWVLLFILEEMILALISCGLLAIPGVVLIYPLAGYKEVTFAELYAERREYALMTGMASSDELIGF